MHDTSQMNPLPKAITLNRMYILPTGLYFGKNEAGDKICIERNEGNGYKTFRLTNHGHRFIIAQFDENGNRIL